MSQRVNIRSYTSAWYYDEGETKCPLLLYCLVLFYDPASEWRLIETKARSDKNNVSKSHVNSYPIVLILNTRDTAAKQLNYVLT